MRKLGISIPGTPAAGDRAYIEAVAAHGFTAAFTGLWERQRQLEAANLLARNGIAYETLHAPFGHINDMWLDCEGGDVMLNELKQTVDHCKMVGAGIAVVHLSAGDLAPTVTDLGRARFAKLVEYARQKGIRIAFENQRKLANIAWAFETFSSADGVDFCWDCGHESCFTPGREYMPLFGRRLICTHIHDNHGGYNQDEHLIPFDGTIDFAHAAEQIRQSPFKGSLMLEVMQPRPGYYEDYSLDAFLARAYAAANRLREMTDRAE